MGFNGAKVPVSLLGSCARKPAINQTQSEGVKKPVRPLPSSVGVDRRWHNTFLVIKVQISYNYSIKCGLFFYLLINFFEEEYKEVTES